MIKASLFNTENTSAFEGRFLQELNGFAKNLQAACVIASPRSVGDIVQEIAAEKMGACFPQGVIADFSGAFARRAMADVAFSDSEGNYFVVDVKTHNCSGTA